MKATRRTQPYRRKTGRPAGESLAAMLAGRPLGMQHPSTAKRKLQKRRKKRKLGRKLTTHKF